MASFHNLSCFLRCEIKIVSLGNIDSELLAGGDLFVRYYVSAGDGRRIRVDTRRATGTDDAPRWDHELAALERRGAISDDDPTGELLEPRGEGVAFELRWRPRRTSAPSLLGSLTARSKLLARSGVVAWADAVAAPSGKPLEKWIPLVAAAPKVGALRGLKLPSLLVEMSVEMAAKAAPGEMRRARRVLAMGEGCGCGDCAWATSEEDVFQAAVTCSAW